jgi:diguanylate cyclase (GGDEF)-like protein
VVDLFSGTYDLEYVNNRLRIGLVHKRIGVEPKLYLSATKLLRELLFELIQRQNLGPDTTQAILSALDKLLFFDITLVVETYIRSLISEIEIAKEKSENYAQVLEERTRELEIISQVDPLTGLLNRRPIITLLSRELAAAQSRSEPVSLVYIDLDGFKDINDLNGHHRGDEVLRTIGEILKSVTRESDTCFRIGGDEFCILMPNSTETSVQASFIKRFLKEVEERLPDIGASIGVHTTGVGSYLTATALIEHADTAMLAIKRKRISRDGSERLMQSSKAAKL